MLEIVAHLVLWRLLQWHIYCTMVILRVQFSYHAHVLQHSQAPEALSMVVSPAPASHNSDPPIGYPGHCRKHNCHLPVVYRQSAYSHCITYVTTVPGLHMRQHVSNAQCCTVCGASKTVSRHGIATGGDALQVTNASLCMQRATGPGVLV